MKLTTFFDDIPARFVHMLSKFSGFFVTTLMFCNGNKKIQSQQV